MVRISVTSRTQEQVVVKREGWVVRQAVPLLEREGRHWLDQGQRLVLELHGVRFIDQGGLELLAGWAGARLVLQGGSPFVQALLQRRRLVPAPDPSKDAGA
jgi:anti-anti-sigma regulatory factor